MSETSDKTDKLLLNYSCLFWGQLLPGHSVLYIDIYLCAVKLLYAATFWMFTSWPLCACGCLVFVFILFIV